MGLEPASVRPSVRPSTLSNMNISETSRPITTKFYLKHDWGGGKAALGFDANQIRTLVSMASDSSHRVIMGEKGVITFSRLVLIGSFLYLQVTMTYIRACMSWKFGTHGENGVSTFSLLFLIGSFSYLQVMRTCIKAWMSLNLGQIPPLTTELAALERLKNRCHHVISVDIDPIFFKLAGNKDMHNIMNEFEFRPDRTTDYGVSCPWASKKYPYRPYNGENCVSTFSLLFLIGSFWYFHITRTSIKAWMSLNFLKWDLTLAHWTQVSDRCPLGLLFDFTAAVAAVKCLPVHQP